MAYTEGLTQMAVVAVFLGSCLLIRMTYGQGLIMRLDTLAAERGSTVNLSCLCDQPEFAFYWTHKIKWMYTGNDVIHNQPLSENGKLLHGEDHYRVELRRVRPIGFAVDLIVKDLVDSRAGNYICILADEEDKILDEKTIRVFIGATPTAASGSKIGAPEQGLIIREPMVEGRKGGEATLNCLCDQANFTFYYLHSLKWKFSESDETISSNGYLDRNVDGKKYHVAFKKLGSYGMSIDLTIKRISTTDTGTYWCLLVGPDGIIEKKSVGLFLAGDGQEKLKTAPYYKTRALPKSSTKLVWRTIPTTRTTRSVHRTTAGRRTPTTKSTKQPLTTRQTTTPKAVSVTTTTTPKAVSVTTTTTTPKAVSVTTTTTTTPKAASVTTTPKAVSLTTTSSTRTTYISTLSKTRQGASTELFTTTQTTRQQTKERQTTQQQTTRQQRTRQQTTRKAVTNAQSKVSPGSSRWPRRQTTTAKSAFQTSALKVYSNRRERAETTKRTSSKSTKPDLRTSTVITTRHPIITEIPTTYELHSIFVQTSPKTFIRRMKDKERRKQEKKRKKGRSKKPKKSTTTAAQLPIDTSSRRQTMGIPKETVRVTKTTFQTSMHEVLTTQTAPTARTVWSFEWMKYKFRSFLVVLELVSTWIIKILK